MAKTKKIEVSEAEESKPAAAKENIDNSDDKTSSVKDNLDNPDKKLKRPKGKVGDKSEGQSNIVDNSNDEKESKKAKLVKLLEKAKKLESKVEEVSDIDLKKKVKPEEEEKKDALVPIEDYLKASIHLGTRVITPDMRKYVYRRRADGLAVFNTAMLDDKIREGAAFLAKYPPQDILLVCKREAGWKAVKKFSDIIGIKAFTKKYPSGVLTNTKLENFMETELVFICDPWLDKNALQDANRIGLPVLSICDTNNFTAGINQIIPGNNKSAKSLGIIFYLLAKLYVKAHGLEKEIPPISEWIDDWDTLVPPK